MRGNEKKSTNAPRRTPTPPHSTDFIASTNTNRCQYLSAEKRPTRDSLCAPSIENQSVSQSVHRSDSPSIRQSVDRESVSQSIDRESVSQSIDPSVHRSRISQSVHRSDSPSIRQSVDRESVSQSVHRSVSPSIENQSIARHVASSARPYPTQPPSFKSPIRHIQPLRSRRPVCRHSSRCVCCCLAVPRCGIALRFASVAAFLRIADNSVQGATGNWCLLRVEPVPTRGREK